MTETERDVNAGLFPCLNSHHEGDATGHAHQIDLIPALLSRVIACCESHGVSVARLVQAAWAIVVWQFAETESVQMGTGELGGKRASFGDEALDVIQWGLSRETQVESFLRPEGAPVLLDRAQRAIHNAAVLAVREEAAAGEVGLLNAVRKTEQVNKRPIM